ncbi:hypothetical protein [Streptomyces sp. NPDC093984]|uniref:hypothetical protein n=1 Tax=Streptomyces sp. NPDC093984 TaxID=3366052 RepID=UPI0038169971
MNLNVPLPDNYDPGDVLEALVTLLLVSGVLAAIDEAVPLNLAPYFVNIIAALGAYLLTQADPPLPPPRALLA